MSIEEMLGGIEDSLVSIDSSTDVSNKTMISIENILAKIDGRLTEIAASLGQESAPARRAAEPEKPRDTKAENE